MAAKKKVVAKVSKVAPKKASPETIKGLPKVAKKGNGMPGAGKISTAQFIKDEIARQKKTKRTDAEILALAKKRPEAKGQVVRAYYVNFYRWAMQNRPSKSARA